MSSATATFAARLVALRGFAGLTVSELATKAGLARQAVYKLEHGERQPSWQTVQKLASALDVPTDAFRPNAPPPAG